ncbi:MAG: alginate export family protein [Methylomicrobium sp.]|nr:alginate export family protein [Methylomicrobium sp.]
MQLSPQCRTRPGPRRFHKLCIVTLSAIAGNPAAAETKLIDLDNFSLSFGGDIAAAGFITNNTNYGAGRIDFFTGENTGDASWVEAWAKPGLDFEFKHDSIGAIYGGVSGVFALTRGDGDAGGFTRGDEEAIDLENYYLGWRYSIFDISVGGQRFQVGDGFLIIDGNFDMGSDGTFWSTPRFAFDNTAILKINSDPVRADLFWLRGDENQGHTEIAGINLEYVDQDYGTLATTYFRTIDIDRGFNEVLARQDMDVISLRATEVKTPWSPNLAFWGEYVIQTGKGEGTKYAADAWYTEAQYTFENILWKPKLTYRYARFSGDKNPDDNKRRDFDPYFYGLNVDRGAWGTWFQAEIAGNYQLFNNNQNNHMLKLDIYPGETYGFGTVYYNFYLNQSNYLGTPVNNRHFSDEINLYAEWYPTENLYTALSGGVSFPGEAAKEAFGDNKAYSLIQVYAIYSF